MFFGVSYSIQGSEVSTQVYDYNRIREILEIRPSVMKHLDLATRQMSEKIHTGSVNSNV